MATITLILLLDSTTVNNPSDIRSDSGSDSRGNSGATAVVAATAEEQQQSSSGLITERQRSKSRATAGVTAEQKKKL